MFALRVSMHNRHFQLNFFARILNPLGHHNTTKYLSFYAKLRFWIIDIVKAPANTGAFIFINRFQHLSQMASNDFGLSGGFRPKGSLR